MREMSFTTSCDPRRLVRVIPPDEREARLAVFGQFRRPAEAVPARGAHLRVGPLRHDVVIPQQHAVQRLVGGDEIVAVRGVDHPLDQLVDGGILDAGNIARTGDVGRLGRPEFALLVARRLRLAPRVGDDVEIPVAKPVLVLRRIDRPHADGDAEALQRRLVEQHDPLEARIRAQEFEGELGPGLEVDQLAVAHLVAGLLQQAQRFAQIVAHRFRAAADRVGVGRREDLGRHLRAHGLEDFQLLALRQAGRHQLVDARRNSC